MSFIIRVTTIDGATKDFDIRDADKAYSYYNSRQSRPAVDGVTDITEWKIMEVKYKFRDEEFDTIDEAHKAYDDYQAKILKELAELEITNTVTESEYQPLEFPDKDWHANILRDTVIKSPREIELEIYEKQQEKLAHNKTIDGDPAARSFSEQNAKK